MICLKLAISPPFLLFFLGWAPGLLVQDMGFGEVSGLRVPDSLLSSATVQSIASAARGLKTRHAQQPEEKLGQSNKVGHRQQIWPHLWGQVSTLYSRMRPRDVIQAPCPQPTVEQVKAARQWELMAP